LALVSPFKNTHEGTMVVVVVVVVRDYHG